MIIGFAGKAASGKTTAAQHLAPLLDRETLIIPMAMVLRDEVEAFLRQIGAAEYVPLVFGCQDDKVRIFHVDEARALAECPQWSHFIAANQDIQDQPGRTALTVRRILQWWGTEYRRAQDPDYWTKAWERKITGYDLGKTHILIDDVRFMNELQVIRAQGGRFIKIDRPGFAAGGNHASETSLDSFSDWDLVIRNDGTLDEFREKVAELIELLQL
jgi:hypothetical protein